MLQQEIAERLKKEEFKLFIGGEYRSAYSGKTFEVTNPATRKVLAHVASATSEDAKAAVDTAFDAFQKWSATPPPQRAEVLFKAGELIRENQEELATIITLEEGKAMRESIAEVKQAYNTVMYFAGEGRRLWSLVTPGETKDKLAITIRRPLGVAAIITPWNFPVMIPFWGLSPALICGNTVVFKPASYTPLTAHKILEIFTQAGLPKGVLNLLTGPGGVVGNVLVKNEKVKVVTFTGESQTGKEIAQVSINYLRKQVLELGGKNPLIVASDADLKVAVGGALWSAFSNAGQKCTAASRIIVEETILDSFVKAFVDGSSKLRLGNGLEPSTEIGPLISERALEKTKSYVDIGIHEGAQLLTGGHDFDSGIGADANLKDGNFYAPTVFKGTNEMKISKDEIFGPITTIIPARDIQHAIELANDTRYGLSSAIYAKDIRTIFRAMGEIDAGVTFVNQGPVGIEIGASFGGVKDSGYGRELGEVAIDDYTEKKTVYLDYSYNVHPFFYPWRDS
jgi:aldehyde dehydrogenase (NAD+)